MNSPTLTIIGLDPGSLNFGYSVIESNSDFLKVKEYGVLRPDKKTPLYARLFEIFSGLDMIFSRNKPDIVAIEEIYFHKNNRSAFILAEARSIGLILASKYRASLKEYSPSRVKLSVTGTGSADKEAVQRMIRSILNINDSNLRLDTSDAIAVSLCAYYETLGRIRMKKTCSKKWSMDSIREMGLKVRE